MTSLPTTAPKKKLGLVIDLEICVGCQACAVSCKEWNGGGHSAPMTDTKSYEASPDGVWFNRIHSYEVAPTDDSKGSSFYFPKSCLHCDDAPCVTVCPTGASYKREEDGIVLVDADMCIGCKLCSWACPYGAREYDLQEGVMKKCTLCVDKIYNPNLPEASRVPACVGACPTGARSFGDLSDSTSGVSKLVADRSGYDLLPEANCKPVNKYLPRRGTTPPKPTVAADTSFLKDFFLWLLPFSRRSS